MDRNGDRLVGRCGIGTPQPLALKLTEVLPLERKAALESVQLDGLLLHVQRDASGVLNLPGARTV